MGCVGMIGSFPGCATLSCCDFWLRQALPLKVMVSPSTDKDSWTLCRFVDSLGYFGLGLKVGDFGLDIYLTQLIFGAVEIPARCSSIFMMQWLGRKWSQMGTLVLGGIMCIAIIFVPAGTRAGFPPSRSTPFCCCQGPTASFSRVRASLGFKCRRGEQFR